MRLVRLVAPALLVTCGLLVTACGAGQVAQTATEVITAEGAHADLGGVALRAVLIPTPVRGEYKAGDPAPLYLVIATDEGASDTLVAVTTDAAASVALIRSPFATGSASPSSSAGSSALPSVSPSATPSATVAPPSASPGSTPSATPPATPPAAPSASPSADAGLQIGDGSLIVLTQGGSYLELQDLVTDLLPGNTVSITFSFARAGDITIKVPVATPDTPGARLKPSAGE